MGEFIKWTIAYYRRIWSHKIISSIIAGILIIAIASVTGNKANESAVTPVKNEQTAQNTTNEDKIETENKPVEKTKTQRLKEILVDIPDAFYAFPNDDSFEKTPNDNYEGPFSVIVADSRANDCAAAKRTSYDLYKTIFTDPILKGSIERVKITNFGYLSSSLGKTDGEIITDNDTWSGETNFYKALFDSSEGEKQNVVDAEATWVVSIDGCR